MNTLWPWLTLALLGAYHGINPGMGWLFAVALGMQEKQRRAVVGALFPMALGHAVSIGLVAIVVGLAQIFLPQLVLRILCAIVLFAFGLYKLFRSRHPNWVGMRVHFKDLTLWSFLMASAHGAGLMLTPILLKLPDMEHAHLHTSHLGSPGQMTSSPGLLLAAVGIHTLSFFLVMGTIAIVVYEKLGLALLRKAWFNLDLLWAIALIIASIVAIVE